MNFTSIFSFTLIIFSYLQSEAQINPSQVISNSGGTFSNANYTMDFTIGEIVIDEIGNGAKFTQGFHQGDLAIITSIEEIDFLIKLYPNPTISSFTIEFNEPQTVQLILSDENGKIITQETINNQIAKSYDVSNLSQGNYFLTVLDKENNKSSYIINKLR